MTIEHTCPPDHPHGETQNCYSNHKCRCVDCRALNRDYAYWRKQMIRHGKGPVKSVDATGTRRRVEALMSLGWPSGYIADRLSTTIQQINKYRTQPRVQPGTAQKVAALYEELWDRKPVPESMAERVAVTRTLRFAAERGFLPPLAWDDVDHDVTAPEQEDADVIDEMAVAAAIDGLKPKLTYAERVEVVRILNREGWSDGEIAPYAGVVRESVFRIRAGAGIPAAASIYRAA